MYSEINSSDLEKLIQENINIELIDVREKTEWDQIRIPRAKLIPLSSFEFRYCEIDFTKPVYIFCRTGGRSGQVCSWLEGKGKTAINVIGSIKQLYLDQSNILEVTSKFNPIYLG